MKFGRKHRRSEEERVLPLINVVFLLLIFFMIAGKLTTTDPFDVAPPTSTANEQPAEHDLIIHVSAKNELALEGEPTTIESLTTAIINIKETDEQVTVRLKADANVNSNNVIELMEALREVGIEKLHLLTIKGEK